MTSRQTIQDFLSQKRLAVVGVSRRAQHFSRRLFCDLIRLGYDPVPVNPKAEEVEGRKSFARLQDISPPVEAALVMTPNAETARVVEDCLEAGVRHVWMYRAVGAGAVSEPAVDFCEANGIQVVAGYCPYMFLEGAGLFHKIHGFLLKLTGSYPR